ncbi:MAG: helix-turn-helix transcriptional regulator [Chloroflexi bacterium]|nr:helix-turn-helix transcriptional regulator [Chloroflexota bacterium]
MNEFGKLLRFYREQCRDPSTGKRLTQERLGDLLFDEIGVHYSGAAVSDWERNESRINADDWLLLLSLVKILKQYGGIKSPEDADRLLESGNYRALNPLEKADLFPGPFEADDSPAPPPVSRESPSNLQFLFKDISGVSRAEFKEILNQARSGPQPAWPRVAVTVIRKFTDRISAFDVLRAILWVWIWIVAYWLVAPSLQWALIKEADAVQTAILYAIGSLILPPLIGAMTGTGKKGFWREKGLSSSLVLHLYVHQGAYVGFHVGYFFMFLFTSVQNLLGAQTAIWSEFIKAAFPIAVGYAGALLIPYNLWLAYGQLRLKDGGIFFVFVLLGPLWAWFFLEFYPVFASPVLGALVILAAMTILAASEARKNRKAKPAPD